MVVVVMVRVDGWPAEVCGSPEERGTVETHQPSHPGGPRALRGQLIFRRLALRMGGTQSE